MSEFENDFAVEQAEASQNEVLAPTVELTTAAEQTLSEIAGNPVEVVFAAEGEEPEAEEAGETEGDEEDDFFAESAVADTPVVDPSHIITVRNSSNRDVYVETDKPMPLVDVISQSGLQFRGDFTCWINGVEVPLSTMVPGSTTVTVVGSVKGGTNR